MRDSISEKKPSSRRMATGVCLSLIVLLSIGILAASCVTPSTPTATPTTPSPTPTPRPCLGDKAEMTLELTPLPTPPLYRCRVRLSTTSDWTTLFFPSAVRVLDIKMTLLQGDPASTRFGWDGKDLSLGQPIENAPGTTVAVDYDLILSGLPSDAQISLDSRKGYLGETKIGIYNYNLATPSLIQETTNNVHSIDPVNPFGFSIATESLGQGGPPGKRFTIPKLVLAFYYPWYSASDWASSSLVDHPLTPYNSGDQETLSYHIALAQEHGIDGFVSSWWGPGDTTDQNFSSLLHAAEGTDFLATIYFETSGEAFKSQEEVVQGLEYVLETYSSHPNFLRYNDLPVIFLYAVDGVATEGDQSPLASWEEILERISTDGHRAMWIGDTLDPRYLKVFDGLHVYGVTGLQDAGSAYAQASAAVMARSLLDDTIKIWAAGITPGYDDRQLDRPQPLYVDRQAGETYRSFMEKAVNSHPDWITITSFNEWWENTHIEPSQNYGCLYLDLTEVFAQRIKTQE